MTLIEVMAGMVILGTMVVSLLMVRSRSLHQWALAARRQEATAAADKLLADWWVKPSELPRNSHGVLAAQSMIWQTSVMDNSAAKEMGGEVVRLEIFDSRNGLGQEVPMVQRDLQSMPSRELVSVDVVLPIIEKPKRQDQP